ncbi:MAG: FtsQ-type POTRA domain-containing protein [Anaerolineales bacterium]
MTVADRILGDAKTRAERVRARRAREARQLEPLAGGIKPPTKRRSRSHPRRRYDLTLPIELGAEIRLPTLPAVRFGPRLASALLIALIGLLVRSMLQSPAFEVGLAEVEGADLLTANQVRSIAQADARPIFLVDPAESIARFDKVAEVADAQVQLRWPNHVVIQVHERKPMVSWTDGYREWWLSEEGIAFLKHGEREGLVRIESETPVLNIQRDPLAQVIDPQVLVAAGVLAGQAPEIDTFQFDPVRGLGYKDSRGWEVYFGVDGDMVMKARLYHAVAEQLISKGIEPTLVSVKDPSMPYYRQ